MASLGVLSLLPLSGLPVGQAPLWTEYARAIAAIVQALALVLGGIWGYLKFVRGRIFVARMDLTAQAALLVLEASRKGIVVKISARNTGITPIKVRNSDTQVRIVSCQPTLWEDSGIHTATWGEPIAAARIFAQAVESVIFEAGESGEYEVLLPLRTSTDEELAYGVEVILRDDRMNDFSCFLVVPSAPLTSSNDSPSMAQPSISSARSQRNP